MKGYEKWQKFGWMCTISCIFTGILGLGSLTIGYINECEELHDENFKLGLDCITEKVKNCELNEKLKELTEQVVETITDAKETVEA